MTTSSAKLHLVHESEAQRQHIRLKIPARAEIANASYRVRDLSVGGVCIEGIPGAIPPGSTVNMRLALPFESFTMTLDLNMAVEYHDAQRAIIGCRYESLTPDQLNLLQMIVRSYLSGVVVGEGEVINTLTRDNFMKPRAVSATPVKPSIALRNAIITMAIAFAGLAGLWLIFSNIQAQRFTLYSNMGVVQAEDSGGTPLIDVIVPVQKTGRIRIGNSGVIRIAGENGNFSGTVLSLRPQHDDRANTIILVKPDQVIPAALVGRPASVKLKLD